MSSGNTEIIERTRKLFLNPVRLMNEMIIELIIQTAMPAYCKTAKSISNFKTINEHSELSTKMLSTDEINILITYFTKSPPALFVVILGIKNPPEYNYSGDSLFRT